MPIIHTPFGSVEALPHVEYYADGAVRSCIAARACPLSTPVGVVVPQYTANTLRKRQLPAILFYPNGMIRTLPLEEQAMVSTPLGLLPAEQITLYPDGALKRVFPLNGTLSGYWAQEDECRLAESLILETPFGPLEAMILAIYFGPNGTLRSLTFWPKQIVDIPSPLGTLPVRIGVSFYDCGAIRSVEPSAPWSVPTPIGRISAWDPDAVGVNGDINSLRFNENGSLLGVRTTAHSFDLTLETGRKRRVAPPMRRHPCDDTRTVAGPVELEFGEGTVCFSSADLSRLTVSVDGIAVSAFSPPLAIFSAGCSGGGEQW